MKILAEGLEQMFGGKVRVHAPAPSRPYHLSLTSEEAEIIDCALVLARKHGINHVEPEQVLALHRHVLKTFEGQD